MARRVRARSKSTRSRVVIVDKDRGWKRIKREIARSPVSVAVGIQGNAAIAQHGDGDHGTVADVGAVHEFGAQVNGIIIPERSFLRATVDEEAKKYRRLLKGVGDATLAGKVTLEAGMGLVGEVAVGDVKQRIADGIPPPNAPATIARKGSSTPLIDKGQLRTSITKEVRKGKVA